MSNQSLYIGLDVGSTTAKVVVSDKNGQVLWKAYERHNARQMQLVSRYLHHIETQFANHSFFLFTTGSGGRAITNLLGGQFVQEVNAVTLAVERRYPNAGSVVELGGQDSKIILWKRDRKGRKTTTSFMNDKCAGGTGATLDKIFSKVNMDPQKLCDIRVAGQHIHHIAAKCGVFAETDVVGLLKAGIPEEEIVISLCAAVVKQNMEVLLHGNVLSDDVVLLGGPHTFFKAFLDIWRSEVPKIWALHHHRPRKKPIEELIFVPEDAQYFAALGAVIFGQSTLASQFGGNDERHHYKGAAAMDAHLEDKAAQLASLGVVRPGLVQSQQEADDFVATHTPAPFDPPRFSVGSTVKAHLGLDGGSTSSKMILLDESGTLIYRDYVLSKGNPLVDVKEMFSRLHAAFDAKGVLLEITGTGVTGYAANILQKAFNLDVAPVETVAHLKSATHFFGDVDVICDVGGQDIKVMFMKHGRVVDIKLNTQCSAGNGYFLQSMANQFGVPIDQFATRAFSVRKAPAFNYGCAVFMEQDKVNFQQLGWSKEEIMAGLALVLPHNIWTYVVQESNLARLGNTFVLQGGTQKNMAAVKSQMDFLKERVPNARVVVHPHADVAGAIGAALEAQNKLQNSPTRFVGVEQAMKVAFTTRNDSSTRCRFCANKCARTFIEIDRGDQKITHLSGYGCDKGEWIDKDQMKAAVAKKNQQSADLDLVALANRRVFESYYTTYPAPVDRMDETTLEMRSKIVVGIPRLLNLFYYAPFFNAYFHFLGVGNVVYSDPTSQKLWSKGNKWGSIDPCFPAKVAPAHVFNLMGKKEVTHICFPMITHLESMVENTLGNNACVIQMGTPEVVDAAFTRVRNHFSDSDKVYWKPLVRMDRPRETAGNLLDYFGPKLKLNEKENQKAVQHGYQAMEAYLTGLRQQGTRIINKLVDEDRIGILFIGHPYHHDPGLNHGIPAAFVQRGFPVLSIESLPLSDSFLQPLFGDQSPFCIDEVWKRNFNRNTNAKIWAARIAARHPNLAVIDMSSFKCGHDAPTYSYVDRILDASSTPHFLFHDIDQNKPASTLNIRIDSIEYFLKKEEQRLKERVRQQSRIA